MLELYDNPISTSAQKVRLVLAEKGLAFRSHPLDLLAGEQFAADYLKINPNAQVPALVHDGDLYVESSVIGEYLDDAFPEPPLKPASARERARMRGWTVQTDAWLLTMMNSINVGIVFRRIHQKKTPEQLERHFQSVPNPLTRERQRALVEQGVGHPLVGLAIRRYHKLLGEIDGALREQGPWLAGATFSLADTGLFPYINRLHDLRFTRLWQDRPRMADWYQRVRARPSFATAIGDVVDPAAVAFAQSCVEAEAANIQALMDAL